MSIDWTNPKERSELFERVGPTEYARQFDEWVNAPMAIETRRVLAAGEPPQVTRPRTLPPSTWRFVRQSGGGKIVADSGTIARVQTHGMQLGAGPVLAAAETMQRLLYAFLETGFDELELVALADEVERFLDNLEKAP
jgi:hypothetical protein